MLWPARSERIIVLLMRSMAPSREDVGGLFVSLGAELYYSQFYSYNDRAPQELSTSAHK